MKMKKFAVNAFQALGATAVVAGLVFSGYSTQADQDALKNKVDTFAFNHLNTTVFQSAHDYMKGEYAKVVSFGGSPMLEMTVDQINEVEANGTFDNPQKFREVMVEAKASAEETEKMVAEMNPNFRDGHWVQADKEQVKCKIKTIRDDGMRMPKQIWNTGTPG